MSVSASSAAGVGETDGPAGFLLSVVCELCFRDFLPADSSLAVPFCVSSCGHIFCDEHRRHANQCPECGRQGVTVEPLTAQPPAPIAHFFEPLPRTLQQAQQAASFQLAHLQKIIRFFKDKDVLNEVRSRLEASTKTAKRVVTLERENARLVAELERLTQTSVPPPPPPPPLPHDNPSTADQRKRKRDGSGVLEDSSVRPLSPASSASGQRTNAPQRYTLPHNSDHQTLQPSSHGIDGRQSRVRIGEASGGIAGLQQFAYQPPSERSRASTPRLGTGDPFSSAARPQFLAPPKDYHRQAYPTPNSARMQVAQPASTLPPRASTSQSMRGASVQPMPLPQQPRPTSSRTVFTNDPRDTRFFPRQGFEPLRPRHPLQQEVHSTGPPLEPGFAHQATRSSLSFPTRTSFTPSTPRRAPQSMYGYKAQSGGYAGDFGPPGGSRQAPPPPLPPQRPIFHQAGRG